MRILLSLLLTFFSVKTVCQNGAPAICTPTTNIKGVLCPDSEFCPCPLGVDCYRRVVSSDKSLTIVSFKLIARGLSGSENTFDETENVGNTFSPRVLYILNRTKEGSTLEFTCIKAKSNTGQIFIIQPFSMVLKDR